MKARLLIPLAWTLWSLSLLGLGFVALRIMTERAHSPEAARGLGLLVVALLLLLLLAAGAGIHWAAKRQSVVALVALSLVVAYPLVLLIAGPVVTGMKQRRGQNAAARTGDFQSEAEKSLADAIRGNDATRLKELLPNQRVPEGRDRAGHSLLEFAVVSLCERGGSLDCLRVLLEAGATARDGKDHNGLPLIALLLISHDRVPDYREAIALLLRHGASADQRDGGEGMTLLHHAGEHPDIVRLLVERGADVESLDQYGQSPVVRFTGQRHWDAAQYLIERGVRLDVATSNGVSLDYYLKAWKDSVFDEHPEGWDRLRTAIAKRRLSVHSTPPSAAPTP